MSMQGWAGNLDVGKVVADTREGTDDALRDFDGCADFSSKGITRNVNVLK